MTIVADGHAYKWARNVEGMVMEGEAHRRQRDETIDRA